MSDYRAKPATGGYAPLLLDADETARMLGISRRAVFYLLAAGDLRSITIGRRRRIPRTALDEYVAELERAQLASLRSGG